MKKYLYNTKEADRVKIDEFTFFCCSCRKFRSAIDLPTDPIVKQKVLNFCHLCQRELDKINPAKR